MASGLEEMCSISAIACYCMEHLVLCFVDGRWEITTKSPHAILLLDSGQSDRGADGGEAQGANLDWMAWPGYPGRADGEPQGAKLASHGVVWKPAVR